MEFINILFANWDYMLLMILRVSGLIFSSPIFGRRNIPVVAKIGYCACIAFVFMTALPPTQPLDYNDDLLIFVLLCLKELLFGLVLGYVMNVFFTLTFTAGQMIDMQMGFGMASVYDAQSNLSIPMVGNFLNIILLLVFFTVDGHLRLIEMLYATVVEIPIGTVVFSPNMAIVAMKLFAQCFLLAVSVALPIIASGLMGEALLGIVIRSVPQINVFSIGLPLKVILGFVVLVGVLPIYASFANVIFDEMFIGLDNMFGTMMSG